MQVWVSLTILISLAGWSLPAAAYDAECKPSPGQEKVLKLPKDNFPERQVWNCEGLRNWTPPDKMYEQACPNLTTHPKLPPIRGDAQSELNTQQFGVIYRYGCIESFREIYFIVGKFCQAEARAGKEVLKESQLNDLTQIQALGENVNNAFNNSLLFLRLAQQLAKKREELSKRAENIPKLIHRWSDRYRKIYMHYATSRNISDVDLPKYEGAIARWQRILDGEARCFAKAYFQDKWIQEFSDQEARYLKMHKELQSIAKESCARVRRMVERGERMGIRGIENSATGACEDYSNYSEIAFQQVRNGEPINIDSGDLLVNDEADILSREIFEGDVSTFNAGAIFENDKEGAGILCGFLGNCGPAMGPINTPEKALAAARGSVVQIFTQHDNVNVPGGFDSAKGSGVYASVVGEDGTVKTFVASNGHVFVPDKDGRIRIVPEIYRDINEKNGGRDFLSPDMPVLTIAGGDGATEVKLTKDQFNQDPNFPYRGGADGVPQTDVTWVSTDRFETGAFDGLTPMQLRNSRLEEGEKFWRFGYDVSADDKLVAAECTYRGMRADLGIAYECDNQTIIRSGGSGGLLMDTNGRMIGVHASGAPIVYQRPERQATIAGGYYLVSTPNGELRTYDPKILGASNDCGSYTTGGDFGIFYTCFVRRNSDGSLTFKKFEH